MEIPVTAILTCGHPHSGLESANDALVLAGLAPPRPARADSMGAAQFHDALFKSDNIDATGLAVTHQLAPDRAWRQIATDILAANAQHDWGWADAKAVWLLEFWKALDPQLRFVLVYSAPEFAVAGLLRAKEPRAEDIARMASSWRRFNEEILRFYHRNPDRCVLVNAAAVRHNPAAFVELAANRLAVRVKLTSTAEPARGAASTPWVQVAIARDFIADVPQAAALYADLESASDLAADASIAAANRQMAWREHTDALAQLEQLKAAAANAEALSQEAELQKLQILQIQEELDGVFTELQASRGRTAPVDVVIDMRGDLDGDNWYDPEVDGRWAGPEGESVVKLSRMRDGVVDLQLDVVDAMEPEILREMQVSMNGVPVELRHDWDHYPAVVHGRFATADLPQQDGWELRFKFSRLKSPAEKGLDDNRRLAIRLRAFRLKLMEDGPESLLA